jgi:hypothetical protein
MKVILLSCADVNILVSEGSPAFSYSLPKFKRRSQKWGTCHIKKKNEMARICGSREKNPFPEIQPITGGMAPTRAPGIAAKALFLLRKV